VRKGISSITLAAAVIGLTSLGAGAWVTAPGSPPAGDAAVEPARTPPRLAYIHGPVSFWRPGAEDWGPAQVNTPLAPGDRLHAAPGGTVELQVGERAFARAGGGQTGAEVGLARLEPGDLQLEVASGTASLDVRELPPGDTVDVNTPDGVLTIARAGYYRIQAGPERTAFVAHRGGPATLTLEDGAQVAVRENEQVVVSGPAGGVEFSGAAELTDWDRWSLGGTDALLPGASAQHVPPGVYGVGELDRHGGWRVVREYGPVWVPAGVPPGWAPYSTGRWIWDPYFEWTAPLPPRSAAPSARTGETRAPAAPRHRLEPGPHRIAPEPATPETRAPRPWPTPPGGPDAGTPAPRPERGAGMRRPAPGEDGSARARPHPRDRELVLYCS
jgi:hypothetical protein